MRYSRRQFVGRAAALPFALRGMSSAQVTAGAARWVLLGSDTGKGVYRAAWNAATGSLERVDLAAETARPSYLAKHPTLPVVYAANAVAGAGAAVSSFTLGASGLTPLSLTPLNKVG